MTKILTIKQISNQRYHLILEEFSDGPIVYNDILHHCIQLLEIPQDSALIIEPKSCANLFQIQDEFISYFNCIAYVLSSDGDLFDRQFSHAIAIKNIHAHTLFFNSFDNALERCHSSLTV